ncbi:VirB4-like conjugal transfer ATPase, CD1110 family [Cuneatibacter caecimuris]|uniref:Type IV secretory pathway VirB4 component n=1 Tax=Cuneatibacter caecimuris TaxID=1796618 RepID=A0A4Q7PKG3_9FIRM|nr:DUF87 domain-containing protein [Cuneatibacter caecimuris]RZT01176.1 type IV secretory pathway VirB4 component [Cuneatibacter caecimuris]
MNKMLKLKKADKPLHKMPKSTQQLLEIIRVSDDGIFELHNQNYSKCYQVSDINYAIEDEEAQTELLVRLSRMYNTIPVKFKLTINNKNYNMENFEEDYFYPVNERYGEWSKAMNEVIANSILHNDRPGIRQEKYLTITIRKNNITEARSFFRNVENNIQKEFKRLGSMIIPMDTEERIKILHDVFRMGNESDYQFNYKDYVEHGWDWKNDVASMTAEFTSKDFRLGNKFCRAMFLQKVGSSLSDQFLTDLAQAPMHSMISIDAVPIPKELAINWLNKNYLSVEKKISDQQTLRNKNGSFSNEISYTVQQEKEAVNQAIQEVTRNDQKMFWVNLSLMLMADTEEELADHTENVYSIARGYSVKMDIHELKQKEALLTILPIGIREVATMRTMLTRELAVLQPFYVQTMDQPHGNYYGRNQISGNPVFGDRKYLSNPHGWIFGETGSGKTVFNKLELISDIIRNPKDCHIIIDPQNEYFDLVRSLGGTVIDMSAQSKTYANPFAVSHNLPKSKRNGLIARKSQLMLSLAQEQAVEDLNPKYKSIIDRCVERIYRSFFSDRNAEIPTLRDFYDLLDVQPEEEKKDLRLLFEILVTGTLNFFSHQSNLDMENKIICFGMANLSEDLLSMAMLIMIDVIESKVGENFEEGLATFIRIDEIHVLLEHLITATYLNRAWKMMRKLGGIITGMTQNIAYISRSPIGTDMLSNSEFVVMLNQSLSDAKVVADMIGVSESQLEFATGTDPGLGLMRFGSKIIPFDIRLPKNSPLYHQLNSNFHEIHRKESKDCFSERTLSNEAEGVKGKIDSLTE